MQIPYDFITWDEEKYAFIGLDHQIPLGSNGITVTEYYGGYIPDYCSRRTDTVAFFRNREGGCKR